MAVTAGYLADKRRDTSRRHTALNHGINQRGRRDKQKEISLSFRFLWLGRLSLSLYSLFSNRQKSHEKPKNLLRSRFIFLKTFLRLEALTNVLPVKKVKGKIGPDGNW
jgi:hypothetical protein